MAVPYGGPTISMPQGGGPLPPHLMPKQAPLAVPTMTPGPSPAAAHPKRQQNIGCILYAVVFLLTLVAGGLFVAFIKMSKPDPDVETVEENAAPADVGSGKEGEGSKPAAGGSDTPTKKVKIVHLEHESKRFSARGQMRRDGVIVRIESVTIGPVEFQNASGQVRFTDDKNYLTVNFRLSNQKKTPGKYLSWYDNVFDVAGKKQRPRLFSADGSEEYSCLEPIEGARRVGFHNKSSYELPVAGYVRDSVIFQVTPEVAANPPTFHMDLPGGGLNSATWLKFEIPPDMVQVQ